MGHPLVNRNKRICMDSIYSELESLTIKTENLLGDALISAAYVTLLPPFEPRTRAWLKEFITQQVLRSCT